MTEDLTSTLLLKKSRISGSTNYREGQVITHLFTDDILNDVGA
jgi:hypothetical protein